MLKIFRKVQVTLCQKYLALRQKYLALCQKYLALCQKYLALCQKYLALCQKYLTGRDDVIWLINWAIVHDNTFYK